MAMDAKVLAALTEFLGSEEEAIEKYDEMVAEQEAKDTEFEAKRYQNDRKNVYPDVGDQLDDLFHAGAFSDDMAAKIQAVKDAHPKPEE